MKLNTIIPLITIMAGVLLSTNVAEAANSSTINKLETVNHPGESQTHHADSKTSNHLLSQKAQKIEFFSLLGLIGFSLLIPELFYKSKKHKQNKHQNQPQDRQLLESNLKGNSENMKELNSVIGELGKFNNLENNDWEREEDIAI